MATVEKVGVEGKTYQNKRTKRICVLESQDTVHKTVLLRDADGKSVSQTFPTFRRDWVAYAGKSDIKTSSQKTEETAKKETEKKAEPKKEETKAKKKSSKDIKARVEYAKEIQKFVDEEAAKHKYEMFKTVIRKGECVVGKNGRSNLFEVWVAPEKDAHFIAIKEGVYAAVKDKVKIGSGVEHERKDNWILKEVLYVSSKTINGVVKSIVANLADFTKKPEPKPKASKAPKEKEKVEYKKVPKVAKPAPKKATAKKEVK